MMLAPLRAKAAGWRVRFGCGRARAGARRSGPRAFLTAVWAAQPKLAGFDVGPQLFQVIQDISGCLAGKHDGEFLSTAAVGLSSSADSRKARCDHAQNLVSGVVAVSVVAAFEVIDVDHGDGIRRLQAKQRVVEGAARGQRREFVVIGEQIRGLDDRACEDECGGGEVCGGNSARPSEIQREERRCECPEKSAFNRACGTAGNG